MDKHGRQQRTFEVEKPVLTRREYISWARAGHRRCHSQLVWQAIQAVLAFAIAVEANRAQLSVVENHSGFNFTGQSADLYFDWECFMRNGGWDVNHG